MLQAFVFEKVGIVVGDLYFLDPQPGKGQEGPSTGSGSSYGPSTAAS